MRRGEGKNRHLLKGTPRAASLLTSSPLSHPQLPVEEPIVSTDEVIFPLTVSLDRLPPGTPKAKVKLSRGGAELLS